MGVIDLSRLQASRGGWLLFKISTSLFSLPSRRLPSQAASLPTGGRGEEGHVGRPQDCPPRPRRPPNGRKPQRGRGKWAPAAAPRGREAGRPNIPLARPLAPWRSERRCGGSLRLTCRVAGGENGRERSRRAGGQGTFGGSATTNVPLPLPARRMPRRHGQSCSGRVDSIERRRSSCLQASPRLHSDTVVGRS